MTDETKPEDRETSKVEDAEIIDTPTTRVERTTEAQLAPRRGGFFPMIAGGVLSAGLGFFAGQYNGPLFGESADGDGEDPIAALEAQVAELQTALTDQTGSLTEKTDALGSEVASLQETTSGLQDAAAGLPGLQEQVAALAAAEPVEMPEPIDPAPLIAEAIAPFEPLPERLDAVGADLRGQLAALGERVEEIEKQPTVGGEATGTAVEAFERDVNELREELQTATGEMTARIEASEAATAEALEASNAATAAAVEEATSVSANAVLEANSAAESAQAQVAAALAAAEARATAAEEEAAAQVAAAEQAAAEQAAAAEAAAKQAAALAALSEIEATLETGDPYEEALTRLADATGEEAPAAIAANAAEGVPTLATLNQSFGPAANSALSAVRSGDEGGGIGAALANRFNVRSSAPRDGDDADAVLSRMDAAASAGDFETVFAEAEVLPDEAKSALADWMAAAMARTDVQAEIAELRTMLSTN